MIIKKRVFIHQYKPPRKVLLKVIDEKGNIVFNKEIHGNELIDILMSKIHEPMLCSTRKISEDYYFIECKIKEDVAEITPYIL